MMTTSTRKNNDKNYYEVLEECYMDQDRLGEPELADTDATQMRRVMMMMPWAAAILQQCKQVPATAPRDVPTAKPTAARGAAAISSTTSATKMERTMTQQVPGVACRSEQSGDAGDNNADDDSSNRERDVRIVATMREVDKE